MTPPIDDPETLRRVLANTDALLLDFDGPICSVFAGIPAPVVADQLRGILNEGGYTDLPVDVQDAADPFEVLFYAAELGQDEARYVEAAFRAHEVAAVQSANPTPQSSEVMYAWNATGRPLAIVSNNSISAVETYLDMHSLRSYVNTVSARAGADVELLKPDPFLVTQAADRLSVATSRCAFIGDSITDVQAAISACTTSIGYANRAQKVNFLSSSNVEYIITKMEVLLVALMWPS